MTALHNLENLEPEIDCKLFFVLALKKFNKNQYKFTDINLDNFINLDLI
jgi:hypothetical protein